MHVDTKFMEIKNLLKNIGVGEPVLGTEILKLTVSQEGIYNKLIYNYFNNFWVDKVNNGHGILGCGTLKSAISQK